MKNANTLLNLDSMNWGVTPTISKKYLPHYHRNRVVSFTVALIHLGPRLTIQLNTGSQILFVLLILTRCSHL